MNSWLDRGLFCMAWVATMWIVDAILNGDGETNYVALLVGASSIALVGLIMQAFSNTRKRNR